MKKVWFISILSLVFLINNVQAKEIKKEIKKMSRTECDERANFMGIMLSMKQNGIIVKNLNTKPEGQMREKTKQKVAEAKELIYQPKISRLTPQIFAVQYFLQCMKGQKFDPEKMFQ